MIRADIISVVGREYLTSNIENDEYSYPKAFSAAALTFVPITNANGRKFEKLDIRFIKDGITVLIETKRNFTKADEEQLSAYVEYEKALTGNKTIAILANTTNNNVKVWRGVVSDSDFMPKETALRTMDEYTDFYTSKINDKEKVMQNTYKLNEMLHRHKKGFYNKKPEHTSLGEIPFLGATERCNGVTEYYSIEDIEAASKTGDDNNADIKEKIFSGNALCVTNNGSVGCAFFQPVEFTCSHDVNPLYILNGTFDMYVALFVATVIEMDKYRWAYGRKWRPERMVKSTIHLPAKIEDGEYKPDWEYMREYIKTLPYKEN